MSEYQYYEFRTINRQLTAAQRTAVNKLSSHGHTTATSFSVDYSWGDFKHDPDEVLAQYFDVFFYIANWGTVELKFCYPKALLDLRTLEPYCVEEESMTIDVQTVGERVIVGFTANAEEGWGWIEEDGMLDGLVDLYEQILQGDRRSFYLAWLATADASNEYSDYFTQETLEPPVPPGLAQLPPALTAFVELFEIDQNLIAVAAQADNATTPAPTIDVHQALNTLSKAECIDFLQRLLDEEAHLALTLKQRLGLMPAAAADSPTGTRTLGELLTARDTRQKQAAQAAAAAKAARHRAELDALAARGDRPWQEVEALIAEKKSEAYEQAAALLHKLRELADERGQSAQFQRRLEQIRTTYSRRSALIRALRNV